ncbi:MAG: 6-carboxytetrahydropterin synthase [Spirochaetia bacterium]
MFAAGARRRLNARHFLDGDFGEESVPHSHPYEIELVCRSQTLDANGFSTDIAAMESALEKVLHDIDDVLLNDLSFFSRRQPSLENLCIYLTTSLRSNLAGRGAEPDAPLEIRIWESDSAWASYTEE